MSPLKMLTLLSRKLRDRFSPDDPLGMDIPVWRSMDLPGYGRGVTASFQGQEVWFASPDVALQPAPAAAACLTAPWSALRGVPLRGSGQLDPQFLANVQSATALMGEWWAHGPVTYGGEAHPVPTPLPPPTPLPLPPGPPGLFFSGGVDSFYSLVNNPDIRTLAFVIGFDIRLPNRATWEAMINAYRVIAQERGVKLVTVFTNLRQHRALGRIRWARYHGAALAAVAHLLQSQAGRWLVSASYYRGNLMPWGSHPDLDWRWSSADVGIQHFGDDRWRAEKLASMAGEAMVHRHLRVCFSGPTAAGNCGRCEKCVRTRLIYWQDLPGVVCAGMPDSPSLPAAIDGLKRQKVPTLLNIYQRFLDRTAGEDEVTAALRRFVKRIRK